MTRTKPTFGPQGRATSAVIRRRITLRAYSLALFLAMPVLPALAQDMTELAADQPLPASVATLLQSTLQPDEALDLVRLWQGDLIGDPAPDLLVQAAISFTGGGNAFVLRHWIFVAQGTDFAVAQTLTLPDGIKSAARDGRDLVLQLYAYEPADPQCCPSGQTEMRLPLD